MQGNQGDKLSVQLFSLLETKRETKGEGREKEGDRGKQSVTKKINGKA